MIVVAGEALIDIVVAGPWVTATPGGAPYNVARGCARLGRPTAIATVVSSDGFGRQLAAGLAESGVADRLLQHTSRPTTLAVAQLDHAGAATYQFYVDGTSAPSLEPVALPDDAGVLVTGGLALVLEPMAERVVALVAAAPDGVLVVLDVNCRPSAVDDRTTYLARLDAVLARADVVKASAEDLGYVVPDMPTQAAARSLLTGGARLVLVTDGGQATTIVTAERALTVPVEPVEIVDTIGAGDAFTAAFVVWWTAGGRGAGDLGGLDAVRTAVEAAHVAAAVVVGRQGADPPRVHELPGGWWPETAPIG